MTQLVTGVKEMQQRFEKLKKKYSEAAVEGAFVGAQLVRADAIKSIQEESEGEFVIKTRGDGRYLHMQSSPGDAPNTDTGELVKSIQVEVKYSFFGDGIFVGSRLDYARYLEKGTKHMKARPWLEPALEKNRDEIIKMMRKHIDNITREDNR